MSAKQDTPESGCGELSEQAQQQTGAQQVQLRMDEREMATHYANAFRTNATAEEVMLDFGVNLPNPAAAKDKPEILFRISNRIVLNYYSTKRLAITLSQMIRRYEEQFGELELNVARRRTGEQPST